VLWNLLQWSAVSLLAVQWRHSILNTQESVWKWISIDESSYRKFFALLNIVRLYVCSIKVVVVFFGYTLARLLTLFRQKIMQRPGETGWNNSCTAFMKSPHRYVFSYDINLGLLVGKIIPNCLRKNASFNHENPPNKWAVCTRTGIVGKSASCVAQNLQSLTIAVKENPPTHYL